MVGPATEEENSIPDGCEFSFAPPNIGGSGGTGSGGTGDYPPGGMGGNPAAGNGGTSSGGVDNVGGDGAGTASSGSAGAAESPSASIACGCTRRPGDGNSFQCPWGDAITVSMEVGPEGGTIELGGTQSTLGVPVLIRIPPGALAETVTISVTETSIPPPDDLNDWSPLYRFAPADLTFLRPVEVRVPWSGRSGFVAHGLSLYVSSEPNGSCEMAPLSDNYVNAGFNQGSLRHLGWAIVGVPKEPGCP
jgi:hypothetical protein